jgi:uncharacterized membrane protein YdjX (TVP38/TMEM64 family)
MAAPWSRGKWRAGYRLLFVATALLLMLLALLFAWGLWQRIGDAGRLAASWRAARIAGPLGCVGLQAFQVVFFFIPGEAISFAAGYVFGTWRGLAYSLTGIMLGSIFNFQLARAVGRPALARIVLPSSLERVDRLLEGARGRLAVFLLFLLPLGPKDALCYGAAFSDMSLPEFAAISGAARLPGLVFSVYLGTRAAHRNFVFVLVAGLMALAAAGALCLFRRHEAGRGIPGPTAESPDSKSRAGATTPFDFLKIRFPTWRRVVACSGEKSRLSP